MLILTSPSERPRPRYRDTTVVSGIKDEWKDESVRNHSRRTEYLCYTDDMEDVVQIRSPSVLFQDDQNLLETQVDRLLLE